ncbi:hypothetical protein BOP93_12895 [Pseudomonas orientalis]|uniref:Uncharacterized protein n=1 Tax=Pseudomonas orientalis TaxID=76758 RepID=A0A2L0RWH0_9PSED|nr:hypothetical protein BOP93_12895 [Pseudomonas orientalis]
MVEVLMLVGLTRHQIYDQRGRTFVDGHFVDFETKLGTFRALAAKYLKCNLKKFFLPMLSTLDSRWAPLITSYL